MNANKVYFDFKSIHAPSSLNLSLSNLSFETATDKNFQISIKVIYLAKLATKPLFPLSQEHNLLALSNQTWIFSAQIDNGIRETNKYLPVD